MRRMPNNTQTHASHTCLLSLGSQGRGHGLKVRSLTAFVFHALINGQRKLRFLNFRFHPFQLCYAPGAQVQSIRLKACRVDWAFCPWLKRVLDLAGGFVVPPRRGRAATAVSGQHLETGAGWLRFGLL